MSQEKRVFKTMVHSFNGSTFEVSEKPLFYPGTDSPNGIGEFIDKSAFNQFIKQTYGPQLEILGENINSPAVSDEFMLFEVGKTTIQMILAQQDCEGIRLIQIDVENLDKTGTHKSFIVQGITKERDMLNGGVAEAVQGLGGKDDGGTMSQEIHGSTLRQFFRKLKGNPIFDITVNIDSIINRLWTGTKNL